MNSRIVGIDETDLLIFVGTNPKTENPVLNARIKKSVQVNGLDVAVIGPANNLSYEYTHLGNTLQTLQELADGTHPFCERLAQAELPMIVVGNETLAREDGQAIQNLINDLASKTNLINEAEGWNGVNILHTEASRVGALDLGVVPRTDVDANAKVVFLLGADNFRHEDIPEDAYVIYMGTSGDEGVYYADLILPTSSYLERNGTYVNMDGRVQQTRATITPPGFARDDWMVLRALSEELGTPLPYDSLDEVRTRLAELAPHLVRYDHIEPGSFDRVSLMDSGDRKLSKALLSDAVDNFYMTDPISRNSHIMARCTRELNPAKQTNFKEWVNTWYTH
jgi:NADH dehydrogenase (ubiquinone) Fe-S protein 1|mmetsp:Transcript_36485/g.47890  ORF Transcript_36485/g.47890 Transcript_36485/m.47890 type:complete len:337 (-) Transcript_36485:195-1205(-)